ncbi:General transcription factor II-I repeat domain-containing protein, partial [Ooceraea biroi]
KQIMHASYDVSLEIAQSKESFSNGVLIKKCAIKMAKAFKENLLAEKFESISLCRQTVVRRITNINEYLCNKLKAVIENAVYYSFCLDESTDICNISQLCIFIRIVQKDFSINEEMLGLASLHNTTKGGDIYDAFIKICKEFDIDFKKCSAISSMVRKSSNSWAPRGVRGGGVSGRGGMTSRGGSSSAGTSQRDVYVNRLLGIP